MYDLINWKITQINQKLLNIFGDFKGFQINFDVILKMLLITA